MAENQPDPADEEEGEENTFMVEDLGKREG